MVETFKLKGVEIVVDYNENVMDRNDVMAFLKDGVKSMSKFYEMEDAFDIINEPEVIRRLFLSDNSIVKTVDLTKYVSFCKWLDKDLEEMLFNGFGITIESKVKDDIYNLRGSKKGFTLLKDFL
jgi:hypothetical protein